jgi:UDP-galactopyranose mutase
MPKARVLVVGAGMAGAVYARTLADEGYDVTVIDKRNHIGGNCYDEVDTNGVRIHRYGPHLFHTNNKNVFDWLSQFTDWLPYEHEVVARLPDGRCVPLPVNMDTINAVFEVSLETPAEAAAFLESVSIQNEKAKSAEEHLHSVIGPELTDLFFRPYTLKMWNMQLSEMSADVVRRLKARMDRDPRYFGSEIFQALPAHGYTAMFGRMLEHPRIAIELERPFCKADGKDFAHVFNSMPIDEYYDFSFGELPYRSIRFHVESRPLEASQSHVVINYTDDNPFTRETWWHNLPGHQTAMNDLVTVTIEEPCDYRDNNMERYYPVKSNDGRYEKLYLKYKALADAEKSLSFIGRCGTYQYLDMHQVVNQSLSGAKKWLGLHKK